MKPIFTVDFDEGIRSEITRSAEATDKLLFDGPEWSFELLKIVDDACAEIADGYGLDYYPNQLDIISSEQMIDAYSSVGMPIFYNHWSFGKSFINTKNSYDKGAMGLAYEIVINSDPCIAYLMEENSMTMQTLVIAHASYGHNSFFKGNYLFQSHTSADSIIDYMKYAKKFVSDCEERHGAEEVEEFLDSCHALMSYGVDRYKRPPHLNKEKKKKIEDERAILKDKNYNDLFQRTQLKSKFDSPYDENKPEKLFPEEPQENILYFIEKNAPNLKEWQRELIRINYKVAQYFYPQKQTQVMNEGWATFWHYTILNDLYDQGKLSEGSMLEFLQSHSGVIWQPNFDSPYYSGINVYALGFAMMSDIKRCCEADPAINCSEQLAEDKEWFPWLVGTDWCTSLKFAMANFKDESFILQYLSPKVIRDMQLFALTDDEVNTQGILIDAIHDDVGYEEVRTTLSKQYRLSDREPDIQIFSVESEGDRSLTLHYYEQDRKPLGSTTYDMLRHVYKLWGFDIELHTVDIDGEITNTETYTGF